MYAFRTKVGGIPICLIGEVRKSESQRLTGEQGGKMYLMWGSNRDLVPRPVLGEKREVMPVSLRNGKAPGFPKLEIVF